MLALVISRCLSSKIKSTYQKKEKKAQQIQAIQYAPHFQKIRLSIS